MAKLKPFEKFAKLIERHWEGIVSYCHPDNKVKLGFVEGLSNKIRVIQRKAYGYRDEEYFKVKDFNSIFTKIEVNFTHTKVHAPLLYKVKYARFIDQHMRNYDLLI